MVSDTAFHECHIVTRGTSVECDCKSHRTNYVGIGAAKFCEFQARVRPGDPSFARHNYCTVSFAVAGNCVVPLVYVAVRVTIDPGVAPAPAVTVSGLTF